MNRLLSIACCLAIAATVSAAAEVGLSFGPGGVAAAGKPATRPLLDEAEKELSDAKKMEALRKDDAAAAYVDIVRTHRWHLDASIPALIGALKLRKGLKDASAVDALIADVFGDSTLFDPAAASAHDDAAIALCRRPWAGAEALAGELSTAQSSGKTNDKPDRPRWLVTMKLGGTDGWKLADAPGLSVEASGTMHIVYKDGTIDDLPAYDHMAETVVSGFTASAYSAPLNAVSFRLDGVHADKVVAKASGMLLCTLPARWARFVLPIKEGSSKQDCGLSYEILVAKFEPEGLRLALSGRAIDKKKPWWRAIQVGEAPLPKKWSDRGPSFELVSVSKRVTSGKATTMPITFGSDAALFHGTALVNGRPMVKGDCDIIFPTEHIAAIGKPKALEIRQASERVVFMVPFVWENLAFVDKR
jgi:hypothetical protein